MALPWRWTTGYLAWQAGTIFDKMAIRLGLPRGHAGRTAWPLFSNAWLAYLTQVRDENGALRRDDTASGSAARPIRARSSVDWPVNR